MLYEVITIDKGKLKVVKFIELPIYNQLDNASYESIIVQDDHIKLFFEGNGAHLIDNPYYLEVSKDVITSYSIHYTKLYDHQLLSYDMYYN